MCHVSIVMCQVSRITCHVSHVTCHFFFFSFFTKWCSLSVEGLFLMGPTPSIFFISTDQSELKRKIKTECRGGWKDNLVSFEFFYSPRPLFLKFIDENMKSFHHRIRTDKLALAQQSLHSTALHCSLLQSTALHSTDVLGKGKSVGYSAELNFVVWFLFILGVREGYK